MNTIQDIAKKLHGINFGTDGIIKTQFKNGDYTYKDDWKVNKDEGSHKYIDINDCCCDLCKDYNACVLADDYKDENLGYQFTNVSHGTHMYDFLQAHGADISKIDGWSTKPVMFVMENPSNGKNNDYAKIDNLNKKRPSKSWYWLNSSYDEKDKDFVYPNFFTQGEYGKLVYSIMNTFKIANGYLTNMVKCGAGCYDEQGNDRYTTTEKYNKEIVKNCIDKRLKEELNVLRGGGNDSVIVFAFALNTFNFLSEYLKAEIENEKIKIYLLPHPANRLANDYRKYVLFGKIMRGLLQNDFYDVDGEYVPLKPDFEHIIACDFEKQEDDDLLASIKNQLQGFSYDNKPIKKKRTYGNDTLGFELLFTNESNDEVSSVSFRYYNENSVDQIGNKASWVNYSFIDNSISLFVGKNKTANEQITEKFDNYLVYNAMIEFLQKNLKIDIEIITQRQEDH